ncbi:MULTISPECIES: GNAT family N-acetyltransferase [Streptomyces]|uniref:GNAT family N-acetyltransferase n=1 Tax=Streptomyces TaxID=1883 RepID=UPI00163CA116|nr:MULTISPECIES: N-acetyltransferase [Streptomyces]MBC2879803.1 N-acetyltransferase [Streptomyces sp. TYQ1024]UBI41409.1 N-acetyltransferase [Streptomyces mobaraensis]
MSVEIKSYTDVKAVRMTLLEVFADVYAAEADAFHSVDRFAERLDAHASRPGWEAVVAYQEEPNGEPPRAVGFAYGVPLAPGGRWWSHMITPLPDGYDREDGKRTLAFNELMIRRPWRGTGLSTRLHDALLSGRTEERVTLLVDPKHPGVVKLYRSWGYEEVGSQRPFPDSPVFLCMTRPLRLDGAAGA